MQSLDAILKGENQEQVVEQPKPEASVPEVRAETPEPQETEAQKAERERDEKGRFKAKGEEPAKAEATPEAPKVEQKAETTPAEKKRTEATQDSELPPKGHVPVKVALEERRKRQELERQLAALRAQPAQATDPTQDQQQGAPDGLYSQVEENLKANLSYAFAKRQYPDFEEVMQEWPLLIHDQPWLYKQAIADEMPAEWAYKFVKRQRLVQEIGSDPEAWREAQRNAIRAELEQEYAQRAPHQPARPAAPVPPPSLANAKSAAGSISNAPSYSGPTPLKSILRS